MVCETEGMDGISRFWRNVLIGAGNVLCLFPHAMEYRSVYWREAAHLPRRESVSDALERDWLQIGMDIGRAIEQEEAQFSTTQK
jgi:hypothetical protein